MAKSQRKDVSGAGFYGGDEDIRNDNEKDGGKNGVLEAELLAEGGPARVKLRFCCREIRANAGGPCAASLGICDARWHAVRTMNIASAGGTFSLRKSNEESRQQSGAFRSVSIGTPSE